MVWLNPPAVIAQLRAQLLLCPSLTGGPFYITTDSIHYPQAVPAVEDEATALQEPDLLPFIVLALSSSDRIRYAEGAQGLFQGVLHAVIWADTITCPDIGTLESLAQDVFTDLAPPNQYVGLVFQSMRVQRSSDLAPGQQAAEQTNAPAGCRSIVLEFHVGLNRGRA